jgi:hypothetical protein
MWFVNIMKTGVARTLQFLVGVVLVTYGGAERSLAGLVLMMVGVVIAVTALAAIGLAEEEPRHVRPD